MSRKWLIRVSLIGMVLICVVAVHQLSTSQDVLRKVERKAKRTELITNVQLGIEFEDALRSEPSMLQRVKDRLFDDRVLPQERAFLFEHSAHMLTEEELVRLMNGFMEEAEWVLTAVVQLVLFRDTVWNRLREQQREELFSRLRERIKQPFEGSIFYELDEEFLMMGYRRVSGQESTGEGGPSPPDDAQP